jgi:type I restriction enzyme S subunit
VIDGPTPYRMIRTTNVRHGVVNLISTRYVDAETFERWNRRLIPAPGDVILTREAPLGEVGVLKEDGVFLGQRLFLYRPRLDTMTADFLSYQMQSNFFAQQFSQFGSGSTVKHLPLPACQGFSVRVPPLGAQIEFSKRIEVSASLQERCAMGARREDLLFASLQHRAFRGEL